MQGGTKFNLCTWRATNKHTTYHHALPVRAGAVAGEVQGRCASTVHVADGRSHPASKPLENFVVYVHILHHLAAFFTVRLHVDTERGMGLMYYGMPTSSYPTHQPISVLLDGVLAAALALGGISSDGA